MYNKSLTFDDVLLIPRYNGANSRKDVNTSVKLGEYHFEIPVISSNMDTITGHTMAATMAELGGLGIIHRFMSIEDNVNEYNLAIQKTSNPVGVSLGINEGLDRAKALYEVGARLFCIDVAHGHSNNVGNFIKLLNNEFKDIFIIAGNVATYEGAAYLADCGASAAKVGIGGGSACSSRSKTGFGVPQLSAIMACSKCKVPIIADGGIKSPGDVVKAIVAGATMVMLGGMLSGTDETPGEKYTNKNNQEYKIFRGMASKEASENYFGAMPEWKTAEGISVKVPYKGSVKEIIKDIVGGLRSGLTYGGANNLTELRRNCEFIEISTASRIENTTHIKTV